MSLTLPRRLAVETCCWLLASTLALAQAPQPAKPNAPGQLVDLGGYHMHLWCMGTGEPAVVLSAGSGDFSFDWFLVQTEIAKTTRVCSYDRGGEAWSELGPTPLTTQQEAFDLRRALKKASIPEPYLLVGHSLGGFLAVTFVSQYPKDVVGLVLVDATSWNSLLNINGKVAPMQDFTRNRTIPEPRSHIETRDTLSPEAIKAIQDFVKQYGMEPKIESPYDILPIHVQRWRLWALSQTSHWAATQDDYFGEEAKLLSDWAGRSRTPLGNLPLIVLSRKTPENPNDLDKDHETHQRELAKLSNRGQLIFVPGSGHHIQLDQPKAVISAIAGVLAEVKPDAGVAVKAPAK